MPVDRGSNKKTGQCETQEAAVLSPKEQVNIPANRKSGKRIVDLLPR
ncbi:MAG: hypothetical protein LBT09_03590 [Planctomycetaceae bacterium]|nr:hypothetical protein [Planctomycetaceae bacterium]